MDAYDAELEQLERIKKFTMDMAEATLAAAKDENGQLRTKEEFAKAYLEYMQKIKGYSEGDVLASMKNLGKDFAEQEEAVKNLEGSIAKTKETMAGLEKEILLAEVGMSKFAKALFRIPILGKAVQIAITGIKVALASIGIGLIIQAIS